MNRYYVILYFCVLNCLNGAAQNSRIDDCGTTEFRCDSGKCITDEVLCDGKADCPDLSDETARACNALVCPPNIFFRCNYGACIDRSSVCNGAFDCVDRSDERASLCRPGSISTSPSPSPSRSPSPSPSPSASLSPSPSLARSCLIPGNTANGKYALSDQPVMDQSYAPNLSTLFINCNEGYNNDPPDTMYSICRNGEWVSSPPTCARSCSPLIRRRRWGISCEYHGKSLQACNNPVHGVIVRGVCLNYTRAENCVNICNSGNWEPVQL